MPTAGHGSSRRISTMKQQHSAVLSLGSNMGDRLENLVLGIQGIHGRAATVVRVSRVYESPAWGFEGSAFLNCALLVHTFYDAETLLSKLMEIEHAMGRVREGTGFGPRIIDIDIVSFNEDIVSMANLTVPHPLMQERLFVLLPMRDLELDWRHPVLQKHLPDLLALTGDQDACVPVGRIEAPLAGLNLERFNYIAIEGNIGAGKTTLTTRIAEDFNAKTVLERFADNPFLPKFYQDQPRYAFPLEMSFLADRYQQIADDLAQFDLFKDFVIADYHIFKSLIFAKVTLSEDEYRLYRKLFDIIYREMPRPDLYVYLYQNTDRLLANIRKRGREYEQEIPAEYLEKINRGYLDYIKSQPELNVLVIDVSERDFVRNQEDYIFILNEIARKVNG